MERGSLEGPSSHSQITLVQISHNQKETKITFPLKNAEERELVTNLSKYFSATAREIMVPRTEMTTIERAESLQEALRLFNQEGHSRIPVQDQTPDKIVGILYAKDLFPHMQAGTLASVKAADIMRPPHFAPFSQPIHQLLTDFKRHRIHMAIVVDEHGGVDGLITMTDIIEELVGEIPDEMHQSGDEPSYEHIGEGLVVMDAGFSLDDFNALYNTNFEKDGVETIGGYVLHSLGTIPKKDDSFKLGQLQFTVDDSNERKILKLRLTAPEAH